jgi:hypothetical protein
VVFQVVVFLLDDNSEHFWEPIVFYSMNKLQQLVPVYSLHHLSSKGVTWSSSKISSFLLWLRTVYPVVRRKYFISAVGSLFLSHSLIVKILLLLKSGKS